MAALRPSVESQRLVVVQRAAKHLLAISALGRTDLGTMDIFPPDIGTVKSGTSDYTWRQQLSWAWAKAGYLRQRLVGTGLTKHWAYTLNLPEGQEAMERIATDPAIAAFYVRAKRSSTSENYPAEWYQPPQLIGLGAPQDEGETSEPAEVDGVEGEDDEDEDPELDAPQEDALGGLAAYFERTTSVLEAIASRVAGLEREVKAQTEFVLEAAQKVDRMGESVTATVGKLSAALAAAEPGVTREDLGHALAEITASFVRSREADATALRQVVREAGDETKIALQGAVAEAVASLDVKSAPLDAEAVGRAVTGVVGEAIRESIAEQFEEVSGLVEEVSDGLALAKGDLEQLSGLTEALNEKFDENAVSFRKQVSTISDAAVHVSESARETLDAARAVSREMLGVAMERASRDEPLEAVRARSEQAIDRLETAGLRMGRTSASALGAGLIRNPGSGK